MKTLLKSLSFALVILALTASCKDKSETVETESTTTITDEISPEVDTTTVTADTIITSDTTASPD